MIAITVEIPAAWFLSANDRPHWAEKARRTKWIRAAAYIAARGRPPIPTPTLVKLVIHRPKGGRLRDPDNAQPTWKACIDGIVDAKLLPDDSHEHVLGPVARLASHNRQDDKYLFEFVFTPLLGDGT